MERRDAGSGRSIESTLLHICTQLLVVVLRMLRGNQQTLMFNDDSASLNELRNAIITIQRAIDALPVDQRLGVGGNRSASLTPVSSSSGSPMPAGTTVLFDSNAGRGSGYARLAVAAAQVAHLVEAPRHNSAYEFVDEPGPRASARAAIEQVTDIDDVDDECEEPPAAITDDDNADDENEEPPSKKTRNP